MSDEELLPCPFCGKSNLDPRCGEADCAIECLDCSAVGPGHETYEDAAYLWNARAPVAAVASIKKVKP